MQDIIKEHIVNPLSFGIIGMQERINSLGGRIEIKGVRNRRTSVAVSILFKGMTID